MSLNLTVITQSKKQTKCYECKKTRECTRIRERGRDKNWVGFDEFYWYCIKCLSVRCGKELKSLGQKYGWAISVSETDDVNYEKDVDDIQKAYFGSMKKLLTHNDLTAEETQKLKRKAHVGFVKLKEGT